MRHEYVATYKTVLGGRFAHEAFAKAVVEVDSY